MARQLGAAGARVLLVARRADALADVASAVDAAGGSSRVIVADLEAPGGAGQVLDAAADETVDVYVGNAGFGHAGPFWTIAPGDTDGMVAVNVAALTTLARALVPGMVSRGRGGVLTVASVAAFAPVPGFAVYAATKAYVLALTEAVRDELRGTGVHATALCPGPVATGFGARGGMTPSFFQGRPSAETVARAGLDGLAAGRRRVTPGWMPTLQSAASHVTPRPLALAVARVSMRRA